ncbi:MAG TPA: galactokinase [Gemmataceae bacterium]|nr:galactokinase [Gemmataceae bacterium]
MSATTALTPLAQAAEDEFSRRFGRPARWIVAAPGRVNLIGEHTDYNGGFVLPMAIDRHVVIAADRAPGPEARLFSVALQRWATVPVRGPIAPEPAGWASYVRGVVAGCLALGLRPEPFEAVVHSDLPLGGGLSSSAALEVATATLMEAMTGQRLEPLQKARLCQKAEHDFAGVPCGLMDQCTAVMGQAGSLLLIDCRSQTVQPTPLADPEVVALIVNSNVKRELAAGEYAVRRQQCEQAARVLGVASLREATPALLEHAREALGDLLYRRARHVINENARTVEAAAATRRGDWETVGRLMYASHASLRDDYEVSCPELDLLVALAAALGPAGVVGSRLTGGGFGGCTVSLVRRPALDDAAERIRDGYFRQTGRPATLFVTRPVDGARVLKGD